MEIEELEEDIEEKTVHSASVASLQEEVQGEANEIEDNVETAVDETLTNNSSYEELPLVEEELAPVVLTKEEEDDKVVASEVVEEEDLPIEAVDDAAVMGDHNSTTIGSLDDPFLLVGKKLSSSNTSLSTMRQDSLQYSLSSKGTTAANTSTLQNHNNEDDDSLFNDVDHDMSRFGGSPEKKNLDEEKPRTIETDDQKPPLSSIKTIKSLSQNLVKETFEAAGKVSPRSPKSSRNDSETKQKEEGNEEMKSEVSQKNDAISITETKNKVKKSEKEKGKVSKEEIEKEKEKPKEEKEKEKEKLPFRAKKGLPKSNVIPAPDQKDPAASDLTPQEMADQAEKQALQQKKEREEKLQLKKFKRNIEKLQQPEDQNKENEQEGAHRKKSIRNKEDHKEKNEAVVEDKPKRTNRRLSKEKPETKDNDHLKPQENITDTETQKQPRSYLKRKVPSTLKKDENHADNDHHLPDVVPSSRRQIEKEESKDPDNPITDSLNPPKRKVHPSKFPAIIRNKVHQKEKFELETSADDSSINTEKRQRIRVPFSSPSERGHHSENNSESKHKKRKPLYLRLEEKARRLRMEEEKIKHEAYVQLRNKRYKQPTREEIKEHMKHFDELLKLKSEEFKQNHVSQMRQLRQQKQHQKTGDGEGINDDNNSIITNNNPWDSDSLLTPKKPQHTKKDSSKAHQQHRSVRKKSKENQNEDFDGHNGDDEAEKELIHDEMMLNNMSSIQDFLITTEDQALDAKNIDAELKSPNELKAASDFIPVTAPNTVKKAEEFISPTIDSPGKNLPNEEIASLLESDWIGRMKE